MKEVLKDIDLNFKITINENFGMSMELNNANWVGDVAGIKWLIDLKWPPRKRRRKTEELLIISGFDNTVWSNLLEVQTKFDYTINVRAENGGQFDTGGTAELNYNYKMSRQVVRKVFTLDMIHRIAETSEILPATFDAYFSLKLKFKSNQIMFNTATPELSIFEKTNEFLDVTFVMDDGTEMYANKETLSTSSPFFKKLFDDSPADSYRIRNQKTQTFATFLRLMLPIHDQSIDGMLLYRVMNLAAICEVVGVMNICNDYFAEMRPGVECPKLENVDILKFMIVAEKYNLYNLTAFCLEYMSIEEVYRVLHHPEMLKLGARTQRDLIEKIRQIDFSNIIECSYCRGMSYETGMTWSLHRDENHNRVETLEVGEPPVKRAKIVILQ